jgi:hypothetical protein
MTDTMTPPPVDASPPQDIAPSSASEMAPPQGMENAPTTETLPPSTNETEEPSGNNAPTDEGATDIPTFAGQKLKHTGKQGVIEKIADDYVIPLSDEALKEWAKLDPEKFKDYAIQVACGMYPNFAPQIEAGLPTRVLLDPYVQVAQQVLGGVMTEPNWTDPKWSAALQGSIDPKTGRPVPMSLDEWRQFLMKHPGHGWDKTPEAHQRAQQFIQALHDGFRGRAN